MWIASGLQFIGQHVLVLDEEYAAVAERAVSRGADRAGGAAHHRRSDNTL